MDPESAANKVRTLARARHAGADIARQMGIRYQHVRNVLLRSGMEFGPEQRSTRGTRIDRH